MQQEVDMYKEFSKKDMLCVYLMWANLIFIEGDEVNYVENHKRYFEKIYDKDIHYIYDHRIGLMKEFKICGYYQGNDIYVDEDTKIGKPGSGGKRPSVKIVNKQIEDGMTMAFVITIHMPLFKIAKNMKLRDCIIEQPLFEEIFPDEKFVKQKEYERQIQQYKCRYIQYYAFISDQMQGPGFLIQRDD